MRLVIKLCLLLICCLTGISSAQTYPNKTVTIVVPFAPGGVTDVVARLYARKLSTLTGGNFNVENKAGAGGTIGTDFVARAPKDGYVLGMMIDSHTITPALMAKLSYDPIKDFTPIGMMAQGQHVIVAHPSFAPSTIKELIDFAKAKPGEPYASSGTGTAQHLGMEMLKLKAGIDLTHVPYKGSGPAINDLVSGHIDVMFTGYATVSGLIKSGRLKPLAVTSQNRLASLPDTATVAEAGFSGFSSYISQGVFAPAATPKDRVQRLNREIAAVLRHPEVIEKMRQSSLEPHDNTPEQFSNWLQVQSQQWAKIIREGSITPD